ncbi:AFG1-like ATPase [Acrodontium crateriforme]|uniref:AFG1-like ATPase n=1 Tax=Acrodontium crateriforme TaxID=150365 RepID=A0AAQ3M4H2_9PEZI|nr:AFG1-like ATPase [Acrodontium crateriforme]
MVAAAATGLAITNPLVKYRALIATHQLVHDPAQLRLALHLQKLYDRLKDYEPEVEYRARLEQIKRTVPNPQPDTDGNEADPPLRQSRWRSLLAAKEQRDSLALTRKLTSHESALQLNSPKGLMLHGEVGTGKSMLIDLFADCLPNSKKRRWHFNTFMLETFAKLESLRKYRSSRQSIPRSLANPDDDHSLLWVAKDLIQNSPILFLDEFQMPDRAASKILTNLMTSFFQLGGVLIATSNRMPEELAKASGMEFPPPSRMEALGWRFGLRRNSSTSDRIFGGQTEFAAFLEVLKARCEVWEMEGGKDYRRIESSNSTSNARAADAWELDGHDDIQHSIGMPGWPAQDKAIEEPVTGDAEVAKLPRYYDAMNDGKVDQEVLNTALSKATGNLPSLKDWQWEPSALTVYGRTIPVPRAYNGVCSWTFDELCKSTLGPADYITLASKYHTIFLTEVPVLTWLMKNEARRFITLLDALYECRCKLFISAHAGPDDLFFPEKTKAANDENGNDAVYSETISEVYQDATAPFRPNILTQNPNYAEPDPEPDYTHARLAGLLNADALEDNPPNKPANPFARSFGRTDAEIERKPIDPDENRLLSRLDFSKTDAFTGEDERFAYKRAQSRLWELCSARWWARDNEDWHRPLPQAVRRWEQSASLAPQDSSTNTRDSEIVIGESKPDDSRPSESFRRVVSSSLHSPFRTTTEPPPKISWMHVWGTTKWGKRAGAWGQGPDGLKDRGDEKR